MTTTLPFQPAAVFAGVMLWTAAALAAESTVSQTWNEESRELAGQINRLKTANPE